MSTAQATLGGGCFWCLEAFFQKLRGVTSVISGYADGEIDNPGYEQVCSGKTGHAEVVQISYDPEEISYLTLLKVFFTIHDPTTLNRQGADTGTQYRSTILYHNEEQRQQASQFIAELEQGGYWSSAIVTTIKPLTTFYPAEQYHQNYFQLNPDNRYCQLVISPKLDKLDSHFADLLKSPSVPL